MEAQMTMSSAESVETTSDIPQDLAFILESGVVGGTNEASAPQPDPSSSSTTLEDGTAAAATSAENAEVTPEKSLAHYRAAVAAARAALEASRAAKRTDDANGDTSASADTKMTEGADSSSGDAVNVAAGEVEAEEGPRMQDDDDDGSVENLITAVPSSVPPRKRRRIAEDGVSLSSSSSSSDDSSDSDSDSSTSSDSDSGSDSDNSTSTARRPPSQSKPKKGAQQKRVETLPAWAKRNAADSDEDDFDEYDEDGGGKGGNGTARGPTTKNEIALSALTLNQPSLQVVPSHEPIRYLGTVSSIIGPVVVIEQDMKSGNGQQSKGKGPMVGHDESGMVGHEVLDTGSLLVFANRKVCGTIFETFGSVYQPMYTLRFASPDDIPTLDIIKPEVQETPVLVKEVVEKVAEGAQMQGEVEGEDDDGDIDGAPLDLDVNGDDVVMPVMDTVTTSDAPDATKEVEATPAIKAEDASEEKETSPLESITSVPVSTEPNPPSESIIPPTEPAIKSEPTPLTVGTPIYYAPTLSNAVLTAHLRKLRGSDASNLYDEEVAEEEMEYSDDEAEAEAKRRKKKGGGKKKREVAGTGMGGVEGSVKDGNEAQLGGGGGGRGRGAGRGRGGQDRGGGGGRGRGGPASRGRGAGGARSSMGGGGGSGLRHRDDMGGADTMMMMTAGHMMMGDASRPFSSSSMALPSTLPARPMFSYDFDNNKDGSGSGSGAGAGAGAGVVSTPSAAAGRRNMPAPYDEHAAVAHTLSLPAVPIPVANQDAGGPSAPAPTSTGRPTPSSRWDQRGSGQGKKKNNASTSPSRGRQYQHERQTQQLVSSPQQQQQTQYESAPAPVVAPHINPLFVAQQWHAHQTGFPYAQQPVQYPQQQHYAQQQQQQHPLPPMPAQQQGWNGYYAQQAFGSPSMGGMGMSGYPQVGGYAGHPSVSGQQMQGYGQQMGGPPAQQQQQQQQQSPPQSGAGAPSSYPYYPHQYQQQ
ncbi:hypothetical protein CF319_g8079 [Tilletia indica]|nr:hypothetical protein CF319_g8079 [Tilletia indica]